MTTQTGLIGGTAVSRLDETIKRELARYTAGNSSCSMRVGIRNDAGIVYRWARTFGIQHFADVLIAMNSLGFIDELADAAVPGEGFDAILMPDANRVTADAGEFLPAPQQPQAWQGGLAA